MRMRWVDELCKKRKGSYGYLVLERPPKITMSRGNWKTKGNVYLSQPFAFLYIGIGEQEYMQISFDGQGRPKRPNNQSLRHLKHSSISNKLFEEEDARMKE